MPVVTFPARSRAVPSALAAVLLALVLAPLLAVSPAYAAKTVTIDLTANGPQPAAVTIAAGDSIAFKNVDATFVHQVSSASTNWHFDSPPLAPGQVYPVGALTKPGTYVYRGANLDSFTGKVTVPGSVPGGTTAPAPSHSAAPAPSSSAAASPAATSPASPGSSASPNGGSGIVGPPPLAGGTLPAASPLPSVGGPAPQVAPTLAGDDPVVSSPEPSAAVAIGRGRLPEPPTGRRYGLPAALAAVAAVGVASLLVRLLLAHPAAKRAKHAQGISVAVD